MSFFTPTSSSVKFETPGQSFTGVITAPVTERQAKVFGSEELAFWPAKNGRPAEPKMEAMVNLRDSETGLDRTLYVPKGRMQKAIGLAMATAGANELTVGSTLTVTFTGTEKGKGTFPAKTFSAEFVPAAAPAVAAPTLAPAASAATAAAPAASTYVEDPWA